MAREGSLLVEAEVEHTVVIKPGVQFAEEAVPDAFIDEPAQGCLDVGGAG